MRSRLTHVTLVLAIVGLLAVAIAGLLTTGPGSQDRAYRLEQRLRCPVCKSVSIAESPSQTAEAMRVAVAAQVAAGRSDEEIIAYFRTRYGDWVLLDPPANGSTLALWVLPFVAAVTGGAAVLKLRVRRRPEPGEDDLAAAARERVRQAVEQARSTTGDQDSP